MARRILGLSIGIVVFGLVALLPMRSWAGVIDMTVGDPTNPSSPFARTYWVKGADGVIYYTLQKAGSSSLGFIGASCAGNTFILQTDSNSNRFADGGPFFALPAAAAAASQPDVVKVNRTGAAVSATAIQISVLGNDGNVYRTMFDQNCNGTFPDAGFSSIAAGFGDADSNGFPGPSSTSTPWSRIGP